MLFWLKKVISYWLMPLPFCTVLLIAGIVLLRWPARARLARGLLIGGLALLIVFSNAFVSRALIRPLETRYPAIPSLHAGQPPPPALAACRYVAVPGAGNGQSPDTSAINLLSSSALSRIVEAVRILKALPEAKLILCGPKASDQPSHAAVLGRAAEELGIAADRMIYIENIRDTEDEMGAVKKVAGGAPVAIATSGWHMPRTMALARNAGIAAVACPTELKSHAGDHFYFTNVLWDVGSLERSTVAIREHIGYLWIWLRGKT